MLAGVSCLDYYSLYRLFTYTQLSSYRLDAVAEHELGENKIEYTGNNDVMSKYIVNNILKNISTTENVIWGPNNTNTTYSLKISSNPVWLKNKE